MNKIQKIFQPDHEHLKKILMALGLIGSLTFIGWISIETFIDVQADQHHFDASMKLNQHVSQLRSQYQAGKPETLDTDFQKADRLLIQDLTHLAQWAQELQRQGSQLDLQLQYRILKERQTPAPVTGLTMIPIEIQMSSGGSRSAYRPYLQFLRTLEQSGPRVDIQEVTIMGDGEKATQLTIGLSLWMKTVESVEL